MTKYDFEQHIKVAVDAVIFTIIEDQLNVLLIQVKLGPNKGKWALPGGLIRDEQTTKQAVKDILASQTGVKDVYLEQLHAFDDEGRDPANRVVSVAYFALTPEEKTRLKKTGKYADVKWEPVTKSLRLAYDHNKVLKVALEQLNQRIQYSNIVWSLLPKAFTLSELQQVYEVILGKALDKRNFRRKILQTGMIEATGSQKREGAHRPAATYKFKVRGSEMMQVV